MTERQATAPPHNRPSVTFVLDQRIRYRYTRPVANLHQRLKIIPPSSHGAQRRRHWHLAVEGVRSSTTRTSPSMMMFGRAELVAGCARIEIANEKAANTKRIAFEPISNKQKLIRLKKWRLKFTGVETRSIANALFQWGCSTVPQPAVIRFHCLWK